MARALTLSFLILGGLYLPCPASAVDTIAPDTQFVATPELFTTVNNASFTFTGTDDTTPTSQLSYIWGIDGQVYTNGNATTVTYPLLADGVHTFQVAARDAAGNIDPTPAVFTWTIDVPGIDIPKVFDEGAFTLDVTHLSASWTMADTSPGLAEYQYAVGISPTPSGSYIVPWTTNGTMNTISLHNLSLTVGKTYFIYVKARNVDNVWSPAGSSNGIMPVSEVCTSPGDAKLRPNGKVVAIEDSIVTATTDQLMRTTYVEAPDRSSGIKLLNSHITIPGDHVTIAGTLSSLTGERSFNNAHLEILNPGLPLKGTEMILRSITSAPFYYNSATGAGQLGHTGGAATNVIGKLATTTGRIVAIDNLDLLINDGSFGTSGAIRIERAKIQKPTNLNDWITVTGVVSMRQSGSLFLPLIRPRHDTDVVVH